MLNWEPISAKTTLVVTLSCKPRSAHALIWPVLSDLQAPNSSQMGVRNVSIDAWGRELDSKWDRVTQKDEKFKCLKFEVLHSICFQRKFAWDNTVGLPIFTIATSNDPAEVSGGGQGAPKYYSPLWCLLLWRARGDAHLLSLLAIFACENSLILWFFWICVAQGTTELTINLLCQKSRIPFAKTQFWSQESAEARRLHLSMPGSTWLLVSGSSWRISDM